MSMSQYYFTKIEDAINFIWKKENIVRRVSILQSIPKNRYFLTFMYNARNVGSFHKKI